MTDIRYSQATNAYGDALRAANNILSRVQSTADASSSQETTRSGFGDMVAHALQSAADTGYKSENLALKSLSGKADLTEVMTAVSEAETALNTVVAIRDRVISAYQDIIKMPI